MTSRDLDRVWETMRLRFQLIDLEKNRDEWKKTAQVYQQLLLESGKAGDALRDQVARLERENSSLVKGHKEEIAAWHKLQEAFWDTLATMGKELEACGAQIEKSSWRHANDGKWTIVPRTIVTPAKEREESRTQISPRPWGVIPCGTTILGFPCRG